jgi:hypothetical protein
VWGSTGSSHSAAATSELLQTEQVGGVSAQNDSSPPSSLAAERQLKENNALHQQRAAASRADPCGNVHMCADTAGQLSWTVQMPLAKHAGIPEGGAAPRMCVDPVNGVHAETDMRLLGAVDTWDGPDVDCGQLLAPPSGAAMRGASLVACQPRTGAQALSVV